MALHEIGPKWTIDRVSERGIEASCSACGYLITFFWRGGVKRAADLAQEMRKHAVTHTAAGTTEPPTSAAQSVP